MNNESGNPNDWIIKDTEDERLEDMRKTFKQMGVLKPLKEVNYDE